MNIRFLAGLFSLSLLIGPGARGGEVLTLDEAIAIALEENHGVRIARNQAEIAANSSHIGNADLLPTVNLSATSNYLDVERDTLVGAFAFGAITQNSAQLEASLTLFDGFSNIYRYKSLRAAGKVGRDEARDDIEAAVLEVSQAYYDVANARDQLAITREAIGISQERHRLAEVQAEYAQATSVDVLSALVDLNTDSTEFLRAQLALDDARRRLNLLLNRDVETEVAVDTVVSYMDLPALPQLLESAHNNNAEYQAALRRWDVARYDVRVARSGFFPRLDFRMSYGYQRTVPGWSVSFEDPLKSFTTGLSLNFNIFNGFKDHIRTQNAQLALNNSDLSLSRIRLDLDRRVANAADAYDNSLKVLALQERNLESARANFVRTEELYRLGQVNNTTFREAQLNLIQARRSIAVARYQAKVDELSLLRLVGRLIGNS